MSAEFEAASRRFWGLGVVRDEAANDFMILRDSEGWATWARRMNDPELHPREKWPSSGKGDCSGGRCNPDGSCHPTLEDDGGYDETVREFDPYRGEVRLLAPPGARVCPYEAIDQCRRELGAAKIKHDRFTLLGRYGALLEGSGTGVFAGVTVNKSRSGEITGGTFQLQPRLRAFIEFLEEARGGNKEAWHAARSIAAIEGKDWRGIAQAVGLGVDEEEERKRGSRKKQPVSRGDVFFVALYHLHACGYAPTRGADTKAGGTTKKGNPLAHHESGSSVIARALGMSEETVYELFETSPMRDKHRRNVDYWMPTIEGVCALTGLTKQEIERMTEMDEDFPLPEDRSRYTPFDHGDDKRPRWYRAHVEAWLSDLGGIEPAKLFADGDMAP